MEYCLISPINKELSIVEQVFVNRGFQLEDIDHYLHTTDNDIFEPELLDNMAAGATMLAKHLKQQSNIYLIVDPDFDGYSSVAFFLNYLHDWVPSVLSHVTWNFHPGKEHCIDLDLVPPNTNLVIALDSASNDLEEQSILGEQGIDVLIIDHHNVEVEDKFGANVCIINNQMGEYPNKSLCGVALTYKFCKYLDKILNQNFADRQLDLVATGLISDMMDLRNCETRHLIKLGLNNIQNPFLSAMIDKNQFVFNKDGITPKSIAWNVTPYVNAVTRMGTQEEKRLLLESMLDWKAYELVPSTKRGEKGKQEQLVTQIVRTCSNIRNHQNDARDKGLMNIRQLIKEKDLLKNKAIIIQVDNFELDKNICGLIANQVMGLYHKPTAILNKRTWTDDESGEQKISWEGSARGVKQISFRDICAESGLTLYESGHDNAFGLGVLDENMESFVEYLNQKLENVNFSDAYQVDYVFDMNTITPEPILTLGNLNEFWGQNIEKPFVVLQNISLTKDNITLCSRDKNPTLRIELPYGITCIKFKSSEEEYESLYSDSGCVMVDIVGTCSINDYYGNITAQILIDDYNIVKRHKYYF